MTEPTTPPAKAECEDPPVETKASLLKRIGEILAQHDGLESNIAINHEYWNILARFRAL